MLAEADVEMAGVVAGSTFILKKIYIPLVSRAHRQTTSTFCVNVKLCQQSGSVNFSQIVSCLSVGEVWTLILVGFLWVIIFLCLSELHIISSPSQSIQHPIPTDSPMVP